MIRKATESDIPGVSALYDDIHTEEESGRAVIGWERGVYPTEATARNALADGELFVDEEDGKIIGAAIINQRQVDVYAGAPWSFDAPDCEVMDSLPDVFIINHKVFSRSTRPTPGIPLKTVGTIPISL